MRINLTLEREIKSTVRFAEDEAGQPADRPGTPVVGSLYLQKAGQPSAAARKRSPSPSRARSRGRQFTDGGRPW